MDGCEIEAWNTMFDRRFLVSSLTVFHQFTVRLRMLLSPLMWLDIVKICMLMIRQVYLTLPRNYYYFASGIDLWTDCQLTHVLRPVIWTCSRVEQGGWLWYGSISPTGLEKFFPSNVCVDDQGPVRSNGVGSYPMKIPKSMDRESVLFWIGQRFLIHITQEGCSGLSHLWRRLLMRKTQQGFIATLYRPPHASSLYAVGGLWIQRLGMQICANSEVGRLTISYLPHVGFIHCELMH